MKIPAVVRRIVSRVLGLLIERSTLKRSNIATPYPSDSIHKILRHPFKVLIQIEYLRTYYGVSQEHLHEYLHQHIYNVTMIDEARRRNLCEEYLYLSSFINRYLDGFDGTHVIGMLEIAQARHPSLPLENISTGMSLEDFCTSRKMWQRDVEEAWTEKRMLFILDADALDQSVEIGVHFIPRTSFKQMFGAMEVAA